MKDNGEKRWQTYLKNLPKPVGIGIFFGICGMVAILILAHNNPLAPDQHTEDLNTVPVPFLYWPVLFLGFITTGCLLFPGNCITAGN